VVVPDGTTAEGQQSQEQNPGTPEEQINSEVAVSRVGGWLNSLFGGDWSQTSGGGGRGGQFMFASLAELDSVIATWRREIDAMVDDRRRIRATMGAANRPAADAMSTYHTGAVKQTLAAMDVHSEQLLQYAQGYLRKLEQTRQQMQANEDAAESSMRNVYPA
jgi:hypothetical protein